MAAEVSPLSSPYPDGFPAAVVVGSAVSLRLFIPGKPVPKGRPRGRAVQKAGAKAWVQFYSDENTVTWEQWVAGQVTQQLIRLSVADGSKAAMPFEGRTLISLRFNFVKPKSTPSSVLYPVKSRTDVDNLAKAILDALQNAQVLVNDNIVTDLTAIKRYVSDGHPEGVEIDITSVT